MSYEYLHRVRLRTELGWIVAPSSALATRILDVVGYDDKCPRPAPTPGVKRSVDDPDREVPCGEPPNYRSATGALMHLANDIEVIAYASKELARDMHKPTLSSWHGLTRVCRYLSDKIENVVEKTCSEVDTAKHVLTMQCDSDCQGDVDGRSTSGIRAKVNEFVLGHSSVTQPGLPALSSGKAERRAMTRAACDGLYVQQVLKEMGVDAALVIEGDAAAALGNASKLSGGRMQHLKTSETFIKQIVKRKLCRLGKINTKENAADLLTKHVPPEDLNRLVKQTGYRAREDHERFSPETLEPINTVDSLECADLLVKHHEEKMNRETKAKGLSLSGV